MKAMILAAGLGTRLRPLTNDRPKALVEVCGRTLLELTLTRLRDLGVTEVIINVHHFADLLVEFLRTNHNFGMRIEVSPEDTLLDTGGGLKKASWFFLEDSRRLDEPFILHNVDVLSNIDLKRMLAFHRDRQALATLAVQQRQTSRYLLFDDHLQLSGRLSGKNHHADFTTNSQELELHALAFSGIHILSPRIFPLLREDGAFSIIDAYLRLGGEGSRILAFRADEYYWKDLGRPENIAQAENDLKNNLL